MSQASVDTSENVTLLLRRWRDNDLHARDRALGAIYSQLRRMAASRMGRGDGVLQPTVLVHEALMRMIDSDVDYADRAHFLALAALKMRSVLTDWMRREGAAKRGGGGVALTLSLADREVAGHHEEEVEYDILALEQALERLSMADPRAAAVIQYSYFGGMTRDEIALVLDVSVPTVDRDLRFAKAWLNRQLSDPMAPMS